MSTNTINEFKNVSRLLYCLICSVAIIGCESNLSPESSKNPDGADSTNYVFKTLPVLTQLRAINQSELFAEISVSYKNTVDVVNATRQGTSDRWVATVAVPANTPFDLTITWYDTADQQRLNLVMSTQNFEPFNSPGQSQVAVDFFDYDSDAFDADFDQVTNLNERLNGSSPFDAASPTMPGADDPTTVQPPLTGNGSIVSRFDVNDEGWLVVGDAQGINVAPTYVSQNTGVNAHITADDNVSGGTWYFSAPDKFKGNRQEFYEGTLQFQLKTTTTANILEGEDLILGSGDIRISFTLPRLPETEFTTFTVPLSESGWVDSSGTPVDANIFIALLANIDTFLIRGEFNVGADTGGLDNVVLSRNAPPAIPPENGGDSLYLNLDRITVTEGGNSTPSLNNTLTLNNAIDAPTAETIEIHNQSTHVWHTGPQLELIFDFQQEYLLKTVHFWNYSEEFYDVDSVELFFTDAMNNPVGQMSFSPALGISSAVESEAFDASTESPVRYVQAIVKGSNMQSDFQNIGFTVNSIAQ